MPAARNRKHRRHCHCGVLLILSSAADSFTLPTTPFRHVGAMNGADQSRYSKLHPLYATNSTATAVATTATAEQADDIASILNQADPSIDSPLPPAFTTCPFNGIFQGPQSFYRIASEALNSPPAFSYVHRNQPTVEVSGGTNVRKLLNAEFSSLSSNAVAGVSQVVCGTHSLRTAQDKAEHRALRNLVGVPLGAKAVADSIPTVEAICRRRIREMVLANKDDNRDNVVKMIDVTQAIATDITWQQILGLDLRSDEEIDTFHENTSLWLRGMYAKPGSPEMERTLEVREYLVGMIETKIEQLEEAGESDGSTVGGLVFATMEDVLQDGRDETGDHDNQRTLSKEEVIDNALLLILASTEITSSTMADVILLMGMHPYVWRGVVDEQIATVTRHGESLTKEVLEHEIPYLEAVMKETMRILPVSLVSKRVTKETIVLDCGYQIPKGWGVSYNIYLSHEDTDNSSGNALIEDSTNGMDLRRDFQPSRWSNGDMKPRMTDYIPFGAGPRKCPGIVLAMTEMKIFLSLFARSVQDYNLVMDIDGSKPVDEQIAWKQLNSVPIPEDGVEIRIL